MSESGGHGAGQRIDRAEVQVNEKVIPESDRRQAQLKRGSGRRERHSGQLRADISEAARSSNRAFSGSILR